MRPCCWLPLFLLTSTSLIGAQVKEDSNALKIKGFHFTVQVTNLENAVHYYENVFSMKPSYKLKGEVGFDISNGFSINLEEKKTVQKTVHLTIAVSEIKKLFAEFEKKKILIAQKPTKAQDSHAIVGIIKDTDGNKISFAKGVAQMQDVEKFKGTTIDLQIFINATPKVVFNALTDGKEFVKWWKFEEVIIERKVGGKVLLKSKGGGGLKSTVLQFEQDKLISYGFYGGDEEPVAFHVNAKNNGTHLKLIHKFPEGSPMGTGKSNKSIKKMWKAILDDLKAWVEKK